MCLTGLQTALTWMTASESPSSASPLPSNPLPPGQRERQDFPRFGMTPFANRFPDSMAKSIEVGGALMDSTKNPMKVNFSTTQLQRSSIVADFHCVTTWSKLHLTWGGFRFYDFFEELVKPYLLSATDDVLVLFTAQDGYRVGLQLQDLLRSDVMLADELDGQPLSVQHGAPLRLVAPAHYGYKNPKHLRNIEFFPADYDYPRAGFKFMDHPRARVSHEERGQFFPGWLLRYLYRPLIKSTVNKFRDAQKRHDSLSPRN